MWILRVILISPQNIPTDSLAPLQRAPQRRFSKNVFHEDAANLASVQQNKSIGQIISKVAIRRSSIK